MAEFSITIATEDDGSQWVELEHYTAMQKKALDYAAIVEHFQALLDAFTTTEALANLVELKQQSAQQSRALDASTTEAIIADWARYSFEHSVNFDDAQKVTRFLRERLRR